MVFKNGCSNVYFLQLCEDSGSQIHVNALILAVSLFFLSVLIFTILVVV